MEVQIQCNLCPSLMTLIDPGEPQEVVDVLYEHMMLAHGISQRIPRNKIEIEANGCLFK